MRAIHRLNGVAGFAGQPGDCNTAKPFRSLFPLPMTLVANLVVALIALLHVWFLVLEMFLWTRPSGRRAFGLSKEFAEQSKVLAANQGLYNGFLAAGLLWGLALGQQGRSIVLFFLGCVLVAGLFGGLTATRKVLWIQGLPALVGIVLMLLA